MANKNIFESIGITPVQALMVGGGGFLIYSVAKKFGLVKSAESDKADNLSTNKKFEPGYIKQLRKEGKKVYLLSDATLKSVAKNAVPYAILLGKEELESNQITLKDMRRGTQEKHSEERIVATIMAKTDPVMLD